MEKCLFVIASVLAVACGCSSFRAVDPGDWRRVNTKDASTTTKDIPVTVQ